MPTKSPNALGVKLEHVGFLRDCSKSLFQNILPISCLLSRFWRQKNLHLPYKLKKTHILAHSVGKKTVAETLGSSLFREMQQHKSLFLNTLPVSPLPSRFWRHKNRSSPCKVKKTWILGSLSEKNRVGRARRKQSEMLTNSLFMNILLASRLFPRFWLDHNRSQASNPNGMKILRFTAKKNSARSTSKSCSPGTSAPVRVRHQQTKPSGHESPIAPAAR